MAAKVEATRELSNNEQVNAVQHLGLKGRGTDKGIEHAHRAQVEIESQLLADGEKPLLGTDGPHARVGPLGATHRGEKDGIGSSGGLERLRRQGGDGASGLRGGVNGRAANQMVLADKLNVVLLAQGRKDLLSLGNDLGANAVARQRADAIGLRSHYSFPPFSAMTRLVRATRPPSLIIS